MVGRTVVEGLGVVGVWMLVGLAVRVCLRRTRGRREAVVAVVWRGVLAGRWVRERRGPVAAHLVAVGGRGDGAGRPVVAWVGVRWSRMAVRSGWHLLGRVHVRGLLHGGARDGGNLIVDGRLGVHALDGHDVAQRGVVGGLHEVLPVGGSGVVADEVQVLAVGGGDAEGLLHEAVRLVAVAGWLLGHAAHHLGILVAASPTVGRLARDASRLRLPVVASAPLALHLAVGEEAARDPARAPRLAIGPPPHAGLAFIPHKDRAGLDRLPLLLRQASLHPRQHAEPAGLEQLDGIRRRAHMAVVCLHVRQ